MFLYGTYRASAWLLVRRSTADGAGLCQEPGTHGRVKLNVLYVESGTRLVRLSIISGEEVLAIGALKEYLRWKPMTLRKRPRYGKLAMSDLRLDDRQD